MPQFNLTVLGACPQLLSCPYCFGLGRKKMLSLDSGSGLSCRRLNNFVCAVHIAHAHTPSICTWELSLPYIFGMIISCVCLGILLWILHKTLIFIQWHFGNRITFHSAFQQLCCPSWNTYSCIVFLGPNIGSLATSCWCLPLGLPFVFLSAVPFNHYHLLFASLKQHMACLLGIHLTVDLRNISLLWEQLGSVLTQSHPSCSSSFSSSSLHSTDNSEME